MKKGTIKSIVPNGDFTGNFGKQYVYRLTMEDAAGNIEEGDYNSPKASVEELWFKAGEEHNYEFELFQNKYPKIKLEKPPRDNAYSGGGKCKGGWDDPHRQALIVAQSCQDRAVQLRIAGVIDDSQVKGMTESLFNAIYELADKKAGGTNG